MRRGEGGVLQVLSLCCPVVVEVSQQSYYEVMELTFLSFSLPLSLPICLSVCLSVCLSLSLSTPHV